MQVRSSAPGADTLGSIAFAHAAIQPPDTGPNPARHLFELTCGLLHPLAAGAAVHYIPSRRGPEILRVLAEQRITHLMVVPQLLSLMGQALDQQLRARVPAAVYRALIATAERALAPVEDRP